MSAKFATLVAGLAATASAFDCSGPYFSFYNRGGSAMSYQRLDPALFPGQQSPHMHSFDGGNSLLADMDFSDTQDSTCTTARVKPDKSLYWRPTLYWNGNGTGYYRVPERWTKIYYKFGDAGNVRANVTEFPEDFSMIAGDPFKRSENSNEGGIKWSCMQENYQRIDATGFPKGFSSCKEGLATEITFPACWNGEKMNPSKPSAHMAYPSGSGTGLDACPEGFRSARFPSIFIEFWYDIQQFDGQYDADSIPWVLANGDPTGFGFHADFKNGWEKGVLAKAIAPEGYCNCGCGCGNDEMKQCFGENNVNDDQDSEFKSCSATAVYEEQSSRVDELPGCNPIQSGPADATQASGEGCVAATPAPSNSKQSPATPKPTSASVKAEEADPTPSVPGLSLPNQHEGHVSQGDVEYSSPTTFESSVEVTQLPQQSKDGFESPATTTGHAETSAAVPGNEDGECKAPVYVTITPTVYVTAGIATDVATCDRNTVYETVTTTATVTVPASGSYKHKRHGHLHRH